MEGPGKQSSRGVSRLQESIAGWITSLIITLLVQLSLLLVPLFSPSPSLLCNLFFSAVVLLIVAAFAKAFKRLLTLRTSAPTLVFFNILFIWFVDVAVVQQANSPSRSILFNGGLVLLIFGFFRILWSDPGLIRNKGSSLDELLHTSNSEAATHEEEFQLSSHNLSYENSFEGGSFSTRVRYCRICKDYVRGFDHHCPAFGNCIGERNHIMFMALLSGFISVEGLYIICSYEFATKYKMPRINRSGIIVNYENLAVSTMFFCLLQVLWQVLFLAWHIYCICSNIKTDEWINWKRYPEFHLSSGSRLQADNVDSNYPSSALTFTNPYDKGILSNLKEFVRIQH